jgi:hypothetical protein
MFRSIPNKIVISFFFVFTLVTGYWVKKSGGLQTGIFFHGIHNFTILAALYYLSKMTSVIGASFQKLRFKAAVRILYRLLTIKSCMIFRKLLEIKFNATST